MSQQFPTYRQFVAQVRDRLKREYPTAAKQERAMFEDCVKMQTEETLWLNHLACKIDAGTKPELQVLDTLTPDQLYNLRKHYAPRGSLDFYIPAKMRTYKGLDPLVVKA